LIHDDLDFIEEERNSFHNIHSFPAKFPPSIPRHFIEGLTKPGDIILDPMMGSGTTLFEALLLGRKSVGFDIDPLAQLICYVKSNSYDKDYLESTYQKIIKRFEQTDGVTSSNYDEKTEDFLNYWFTRKTKEDLKILISIINEIEDNKYRKFFQLIFSSIIITKSGGVSLALDLGHTRPHKAKRIFKQDEVDINDFNYHRDKRIKDVKIEFSKKYKKSVNELIISIPKSIKPIVINSNAKYLPIKSNSIDLIVTSPPYANNAIDYMRAHKFSLVFMGNKINDLSSKKSEYIGNTSVTDQDFLTLPDFTNFQIKSLNDRNNRKALSLLRYFSEMKIALSEMKRVLKVNQSCVIVIGDSTINGLRIPTSECVAEIGVDIGLNLVGLGERNIDRNKRMLPTSIKKNSESIIQQRMHTESIIAFTKT